MAGHQDRVQEGDPGPAGDLAEDLEVVEVLRQALAVGQQLRIAVIAREKSAKDGGALISPQQPRKLSIVQPSTGGLYS